MIIPLSDNKRVFAYKQASVDVYTIYKVRIETLQVNGKVSVWLMARNDGEFIFTCEGNLSRATNILVEVTRRYPEFVLAALYKGQ